MEEGQEEEEEEVKQMWIAHYTDGARVRIWGPFKSAYNHALALQRFRTHYYKQMIALTGFMTEATDTALDDVFFVPVEPMKHLLSEFKLVKQFEN